MNPEIVIVGAGIIGCAIAHELSRRGAKVRLFEARAVGAGATQASAGVLAPSIEAHARGPLFDLMWRSLLAYDQWIQHIREDSAIDVEYRRCGTLEIAADDASEGRLMSAAEGDAALEWLDAAAARALEPALPESIQGALLAVAHGYVAVPVLMEALAWAALRHGVEIETNQQIAGIAREGTAVGIVCADGTRFFADRVILATGSWTSRLDLDEVSAADVRPIRGQLLRLGWSGPALSHVLWGTDCYVVPWNDRTALVGATVEDVGFDERTTAAGVRDLLDAVCELLPHAWAATFLEARVGLRPATSDGFPIIGPSAIDDRVIYATGHFRNGVLLAPVTASIVAEFVLENRQDPALEFLQPGRFARSR